MKANVSPVGRNPNECSRVVALEVARLKSLSLFVRESGPVDSAFKAAKLRHLHAVLHKRAPYKFL